MKLEQTFQKVQSASRTINLLTDENINEILLAVADAAVAQSDFILEENKKDLSRMDPKDPKYDRLMLTKERIEGIAADIRNVATLPSPLGKILSETNRPNGMKISKVTVPFGVIGIIYEARPNVSFDVFSLCLKSGNACLLKGGSDAHDSNSAIVGIIQNVLEKQGVIKDIVTLLPPDREATAEMLNAVGYVDLIIPRGSQGLINFVRDNSKIPVIETGAGVCHTYFDESGDLEKGAEIIFNSKTRRVSVCNSLDCVIVNEKRLSDLSALCLKMAEKNVIIYADQPAYAALKGKYPADLLEHATDESFGTEFLDYKLSVKTVANLEEAIDHITKYSSKHSEAIVSENAQNISVFEKMVDAACVYANVSTAFTDGAQFGLGAEIGISTQKLHARGPMALEELTSYKYIIRGNGQTRA
ncbi:glutamate-5-semialdehyde dehydrogenase [Parabacteroides sp. FAFU027]|uniref:glutamate-5-semialdehyde dehydrogenase n=1 Tax=Parabacteroides sp. FAFU027 TaxID=2922715 RepID=UPI001FAF0C40|nr:glutamate-5-semialdehyde dehydrogenase [Parabacteroides sp. FAFU027]